MIDLDRLSALAAAVLARPETSAARALAVVADVPDLVQEIRGLRAQLAALPAQRAELRRLATVPMADLDLDALERAARETDFALSLGIRLNLRQPVPNDAVHEQCAAVLVLVARVRAAEADRDAARKEAEQLQVQLSGCGVAALGGTTAASILSTTGGGTP